MAKFYRKQLLLAANQVTVWDVLTNPIKTKQYMYGCEVLSSWQVGDSIIWKGLTEDGQEIVYVKGEITEIEPGNMVRFTMFDPNMGLEDIPANYVSLTYQLTPEGEHTLLDLEQGDFDAVANGEKRYEETVKGWEFVFPMLEKVVSGG